MVRKNHRFTTTGHHLSPWRLSIKATWQFKFSKEFPKNLISWRKKHNFLLFQTFKEYHDIQLVWLSDLDLQLHYRQCIYELRVIIVKSKQNWMWLRLFNSKNKSIKYQKKITCFRVFLRTSMKFSKFKLIFRIIRFFLNLLRIPVMCL